MSQSAPKIGKINDDEAVVFVFFVRAQQASQTRRFVQQATDNKLHADKEYIQTRSYNTFFKLYFSCNQK